VPVPIPAIAAMLAASASIAVMLAACRRVRSSAPILPATGRAFVEKVIASLATCPIPEVARLGRTLRAWRVQVLAYFDTGGVSNGGTEAIGRIIEKTYRLGHGYRNFPNYRLRMLLAANGQRTYRRARPAKPSPPSAAKPVSPAPVGPIAVSPSLLNCGVGKVIFARSKERT